MNATQFKSMDICGPVDTFNVIAWDYEQVGAPFRDRDVSRHGRHLP
jgi:hypothetical protein